MEIKELVNLWIKTQLGHHLDCREATKEFADIMWGLYEEQKNEQ